MKKVLSIALAAFLALSVFPLSTFAASPVTIQNGQYSITFTDVVVTDHNKTIQRNANLGGPETLYSQTMDTHYLALGS